MKNRILSPTSWLARCRGLLSLLALLLLAGQANAQSFPSWQFARAFDQTTGGGTSITRATAVDRVSGAVYVTGQFTNQITFGSTVLTSAGGNDIFVARYDPGPGTWAWAKSGGGTGSDIGNGIATDGTNVYVTGTTSGTPTFAGQTATVKGLSDVFIAAYSASSGSDVWARIEGGTVGDQGNAIATDGTNVYITGFYQNGTVLQGQNLSGRNAEGFVAAYTASSGGNVWVKNFGGGGGNASNDQGTGIATDGTNVYITGTFEGPDITVAGQTLTTVGGFDVLVAAYTASSGSSVWARSAGGTGTDFAAGITTDATNVYITGFFFGTSTYAGQSLMSTPSNREDIFVAAYTTSGGDVWARGDGGSFNDRSQGIATDGRRVYVTGFFTGAATFAGQSLTGAGGNEVFVAGYTTATGGNVGARSAGGNNPAGGVNNDIGISIGTDGANLYAGGQVYLPASPRFDAITLTGTTNINGFLAGLVVATPILTSVLPTNGPVGTSVTLTGSGFIGTTGVSFNGTAATFTVNSGISITVTVPAGATTGNVTVSNASGPSNGVLFTVTTTPAVTTATPTNVTTTTATLGGTVVSDGSTPVTERGVVYVPGTGTPTMADTKLTAAGTTGAFTVSATGLLAGTQYTVRAYATNVNGTSYGSSVGFTTTAAAPTLTSLSPTSGVVGTSITLMGTGFTGATSVSFNGTAAAVTVTNATTAMATVPTGATTGNVTITTPDGTSNGVAFTVTAAPTATTWTGAVSTDWFTAGNWTNGVPTATLDALIPASAPNMPAIAAGTATAKALALNAGSSLTQTGGTLDVRADLTNHGTFQPTGGTVALGTSTPANILGSSGIRFWNLTAGPSGAQSGTAASTSVQRLLTLDGNFSTQGNPFTLESNATSTALVVNNSGTVIGTATVQRYIDPSRNPGLGYRHYSAPVQSTTVADLATSGFSPVVNPAYNTAAVPSATTPFPTVYGYDEARLSATNATTQSFDQGFFSPATLSDNLNPGRGYTVNINASEKVDLTGTLNTGTVPVGALSRGTEANAGWQLLGNPYPAPLDWNVARTGLPTGVIDAIYTFKSATQYTGSYEFYQNGFGTLPGGLVPAMQGFFLRVSQNVPAFSFQNNWRVTTYQNPTFNRTTADTRPAVQLDLVSAAGTHEPTFVYFENGATAGFDAHYDADKLPNSTGLNLSSEIAGGQRLAVNGLPLLGTAALTVPLTVGVPAAGTYALTAAQLLNLGTTPVSLHDRQTGAVLNLANQARYSFTTAAGALLTGRFELVFAPQRPLAVSNAALATQVGLYPNPATAAAFVELPAALGRTAVTASLVDALGRPVRTQVLPAQGAAAHRLALAGVATGVYTLRLATAAGVLVKKLVVE